VCGSRRCYAASCAECVPVCVRSLFVGLDRTPAAALTARARKLWEYLAGAAAGFTPAVSVVVSPRSYLCPPGWAGIVVLGDAALATAPDHETARFVEQALSGLPAASLTGTEVLSRRLPVAEILGPAALAYLNSANFRPQPGDAVTTPLGLDHPGFRQFLLAADTDDVEESGIQEITTPAFAVREHGQVIAAAGYRDWPCGTAHLSVLTASAARGRGLARAAASAAVAHAIEEGRLAQWRARPQASRRVAQALGFRELGFQVSIRLAAGVTSCEH
jgi:RimJ/RimL family protein N-acetyltransferase